MPPVLPETPIGALLGVSMPIFHVIVAAKCCLAANFVATLMQNAADIRSQKWHLNRQPIQG